MPGPPESGVTSPARRNRTRPIQRLSPVDVPEVSEIRSGHVADLGTLVKTTSLQRCLRSRALLASIGASERKTKAGADALAK